MTINVQSLAAAIATVCPIDGVSIGDESNRATWRIDFKDAATADQRAAATTILTSFDEDSPPGAAPAPLLDLKAYAAAKRYVVETAGITVGGVAVRTDRASQATLTGAFNYAQQNPAAIIKWKTATGVFVDLDAATVTAVANAVGAHVQACFAKEAEVAAAIDAGTITDTAGVDAAFAA